MRVLQFLAVAFLVASMMLPKQTGAQPPQKMSYQAVIRNSSGQLVANKTIGMRISILQGSADGIAVYIETFNPATNANGLVSIEIGAGTTTNDFSKVDWSNGPFFIKTETDLAGNTNYSITGVSQLLSVPFAFYAKTAEQISGKLTETDPVFNSWDKSSGIKIRENQIQDLKHFTNTDEADPKYIADSSFIKTGVRSWNNSLAKTINTKDTAYWGRPETDPVFSAWDKSSGIRIAESQITGLDHFTNADETDPKFVADSSFLKTGVRSWNNSFAKTIVGDDTTRWGRAETDPVFSVWDKSSGIRITESQITDLDHFTNADETDPKYIADSLFLKNGVRSWNNSFARTIVDDDTIRWGRAETDPRYIADSSFIKTGVSSWNNSLAKTIAAKDTAYWGRSETDPKYTADSSLIKTGIRSWNSSLAKTIDSDDTTRWGRMEMDPFFSAWNRSSGINITESQITNLRHFTNSDETDPKYIADSSYIKSGVRSWNGSLAKTIDSGDTTWWGRAEIDPFFTAWNKSSGINITESQITDLHHFTNSDETDPKFAADSSFIKSGVRGWNSSLAKTIDSGDTTWWGRAEIDPFFTAWNKSSGINITESQITDLRHFTNSDETDPKFTADSSLIKSVVRSWNGSLAKTIDSGDTTWWGRAEIDPFFSAWNRSSGINITESQITDLRHFTNSDESDPKFASDSSFIKLGVRDWNSSLAKTIDPGDTTWWGRAEIDPFFSAWNRSSGIYITENQITDLRHFTNSDETDQIYATDSSFIKSGVRDWNSSLAKTIDDADTTYWGRAETDPVFSAWDKSTGITITESQITNLDHFTNSDETDQIYAADSSFIKSGIRDWNSSLAKTIDVTDTTYWGNKNYSSLTNAPNIANSTLDKSIILNTGGSLSMGDAANTYLRLNQSTGNIGIGNNVTSPRAELEIGGTDGLIATGIINQGIARALGAGLRFHWYPRKGAFRVGNAETTWWDDDGSANPKMSLYSIAMGYQPRASAVASTAIGAYNQATGDYSLSLGSYSQATQSHAVAIGTQAYATGIYSIALGSGANTNGKDGSMVVGDDAYFQTAYSSADNQLTMRFIGGYRLWSSYPDSTAGVYMRHGQNGWSNYCDRNKKTNFKTLDYEEILKKIEEKVPITEWSYIGTDPTDRYFGPMAQDFYAAFKLGGTDSLGINTISIDGVNMAAIHGLIDRTNLLKAAVEELQLEKQKVIKMEALLNEQNEWIKEMKNQFDVLKNEVSKYAVKNKEPLTEPQANNLTH
jgi:hypothetical protein